MKSAAFWVMPPTSTGFFLGLPFNHGVLLSELYGIMTQKTAVFIVITVGTSASVQYSTCSHQNVINEFEF